MFNGVYSPAASLPTSRRFKDFNTLANAIDTLKIFHAACNQQSLNRISKDKMPAVSTSIFKITSHLQASTEFSSENYLPNPSSFDTCEKQSV